jgi:RNA polymerase sigma factor (sigma-70 family)
MGATGMIAGPDAVATSDTDLVAAVRDGDDHAFEELYRRYQRRISGFVGGLVRDEARTEDVTQEAFFSALRRLRATDSEIAFKPWIYEIARNAAIDSYRRTSRAEEVSMDSGLLRPSDRGRLIGSRAPESALVVKERLEHLRGALDELSDTHHRVLVMRELEGLSYREIGERLDLSRPAVESTLFRARRRLEREYEELDTGRRCETMRKVIAQLAEGVESGAGPRRLARHAKRCSACRRLARELGIEPLAHRNGNGIASRAAALLPLPAILRRRTDEAASSGAATGGAQVSAPLTTALGPGIHGFAALGERAVAVIAAAAFAGAGGAMIAGVSPSGDERSGAPPAAPAQVAPAGDRERWADPGDAIGGSALPGPERLEQGGASRRSAPAEPSRPGAPAAPSQAAPRAPGAEPRQLVPDVPVPKVVPLEEGQSPFSEQGSDKPLSDRFEVGDSLKAGPARSGQPGSLSPAPRALDRVLQAGQSLKRATRATRGAVAQ